MTIIIATILLFHTACLEQSPETFTLTGKLPIDGYDGRIVYLCRLDNELTNYINIDSSFIKGDTFSFKDTATDSLVARYIFIGEKNDNRIDHPKLLFIPEKGEILMTLNKNYEPVISGTPKNDAYESINAIIAPLQKQNSDNINDFFKAYADNGKMDFDLLENSDKSNNDINKAVFSYLMEIKQTYLFDDVYSDMSHYINDDQKNIAQGWVGSLYKNKMDKYNQIIRNKQSVQ